ncbi:MAG: ExeA family protein [Acidobacteriota bacterium]
MYRSHFGLIEPPFSLTPDPDFVYVDMQHQTALDTLMLALESGEGFVKVTGEVGTGKTLLCRRLMAALPASVVSAYLFNPRLEPQGLLRALAIELGLSPTMQDDEHAIYQMIEGELLQLAAQGHRVVCCIDEAHALPVASLEALRMLSNLETNKRKLLQIALFGQPELDQLLRTPALRSLASRMGFGVRLDGLALKDFRRYLKHRMTVAGWQGQRVFTDAASWMLWRASRGVPRMANVLAHQCLMLAYGKGTRTVCFKDAWSVCLERQRVFGPVARRQQLANAWQGDRS